MTQPPEGPPAPDPWALPQGSSGGLPPPPPPQPTWTQQPAWGPQPGWGQQTGWSPPPEAARPTNPWSIVALVTGIVALVPVALVAGVVGLVQARRRQQPGTGLAVAGLVLAGVWLVVFAAIGFFVASGDLYDDLGPVAAVPVQEVGTCLNKLSASGTWVVTDCSSRHDAEVYQVSSVDTGVREYDAGDLQVIADDLCMETFSDYTGESYYVSDHEYGFFSPDEPEWLAGTRTVVCVITPGPFQELEGSARG